MNEVIEYQELLNSISSTKAWQYYPFENVVQSLKKESNLPLSLIAFENTQGVGVDPYYGLPYGKYLYYINTENPRNSLNHFFVGAGRNIIPKLQEKTDGLFKITEFLPAMTFSKSITVAEAVPTPIVESAELSLSFSATLTALDSKIAGFMELEKEFKGDFSIKAKSAYDHVFSNFKMVLGPSSNGFPMDMGVKNEILIGDNSGTFTSKVSITQDTDFASMMETAVTRGAVQRYKGTSSGEYSGSCKFTFGGTEWQIDFTIGYEVDAKLLLDGRNYSGPFEYKTVEINVMGTNAVSSPYGVNVNTENQPDTWWDRSSEAIAVIGESAGIALVGTAIILGGVALAPESLGTSFAAGLVSGGRMVLMGFQMLKPVMN